ncbi:MAG: C69 family dipeptidase [Chloroflexota bacterium]|nr:C69 family dipeptidase [Chloroflexota bacterium]
MLFGCDTMVALPSATRHGQTLFAKNSDRPSEECQPLVQRERRSHTLGAVTRCQFVRLPEVPVTYRHIGSRPYWCWGYEHGFNEHQVVIGNEGLASRNPEFAEPKLIGMEILRLALERGRTAVEAVEVMTALIGRYGQGKFSNTENVRTYDNGYIVADPREAYVIETAGHEWAVKRVECTLGISNVHSIGTDWDRLSPGAEQEAVKKGWWAEGIGRLDFAKAFCDYEARAAGRGSQRLARTCAVLDLRAGRTDLGTMMSLLRDHSSGDTPGEPFQTGIRSHVSVCMHYFAEREGNTAASLVADLCADGSRLPVYWCSMYSPCLGVFLPTFIEGTLPPALAVGDKAPSNDSLWWLFRKLERRVRRERDAGCPEAVESVRVAWRSIEDDLLSSAYRVASDARHMMDKGRAEEASLMLTEYMDRNLKRVLTTVHELLGERASVA